MIQKCWEYEAKGQRRAFVQDLNETPCPFQLGFACSKLKIKPSEKRTLTLASFCVLDLSNIPNSKRKT